VAPDGHAVCVHAHVEYEHSVGEHFVVTVVDAASRRHKPGFASSRKSTVFDSNVKVPGIAPDSLLLRSDLLSQNGARLCHEYSRARNMHAIYQNAIDSEKHIDKERRFM
jgi:hypothetical protein